MSFLVRSLLVWSKSFTKAIKSNFCCLCKFSFDKQRKFQYSSILLKWILVIQNVALPVLYWNIFICFQCNSLFFQYSFLLIFGTTASALKLRHKTNRTFRFDECRYWLLRGWLSWQLCPKHCNDVVYKIFISLVVNPSSVSQSVFDIHLIWINGGKLGNPLNTLICSFFSNIKCYSFFRQHHGLG